MYVQRVGYLGYKLYSMGWKSALHHNRPALHHWLLSIFFYYRQGFTEGSNWIEADSVQQNLR